MPGVGQPSAGRGDSARGGTVLSRERGQCAGWDSAQQGEGTVPGVGQSLAVTGDSALSPASRTDLSCITLSGGQTPKATCWALPAHDALKARERAGGRGCQGLGGDGCGALRTKRVHQGMVATRLSTGIFYSSVVAVTADCTSWSKGPCKG